MEGAIFVPPKSDKAKRLEIVLDSFPCCLQSLPPFFSAQAKRVQRGLAQRAGKYSMQCSDDSSYRRTDCGVSEQDPCHLRKAIHMADIWRLWTGP